MTTLLNKIPVISKQTFVRKEDSMIIVIPPGGSINDSMFLKDTSREIFELCDGEHSIDNIINILNTKYSESNISLIKSDVLTFLVNLKRKKVIICNLEEIMYKEIKIGSIGNYTIFRLGEGNLKLISTLIEKKQCFFQLTSSPHSKKIILRNNLFNFLEEFYIIKKDNNIEFLISFSKTNPFIIKISNFKVFENILESQEFNSCFELILSNFQNLVPTKINKFRIPISSNTKNINIISEKLKENGFLNTAIFKDEFETGIDLLFFDLKI